MERGRGCDGDQVAGPPLLLTKGDMMVGLDDDARARRLVGTMLREAARYHTESERPGEKVETLSHAWLRLLPSSCWMRRRAGPPCAAPCTMLEEAAATFWRQQRAGLWSTCSWHVMWWCEGGPGTVCFVTVPTESKRPCKDMPSCHTPVPAGRHCCCCHSATLHHRTDPREGQLLAHCPSQPADNAVACLHCTTQGKTDPQVGQP